VLVLYENMQVRKRAMSMMQMSPVKKRHKLRGVLVRLVGQFPQALNCKRHRELRCANVLKQVRHASSCLSRCPWLWQSDQNNFLSGPPFC